MSEIILYENSEGKVKVEVRFENETFWLSQKSMAGLFGCSTDNISLHLICTIVHTVRCKAI